MFHTSIYILLLHDLFRHPITASSIALQASVLSELYEPTTPLQPPLTPTEANTKHPINALHDAPTAAKPTACKILQSSKIFKAAILFIMTAQLTALAEDGKSYDHIRSKRGNNFVNDDMRSAELTSDGWG